MELTKLEFAVETKQLKEAVDLLGKVQQGTAALGKAQDTQEKSAKKSAKAQKDVAEASEEAEKKLSPLEKLLEKLNNQYGDLVKGFTKGEAAILQQARSYGAAEDALQPFIRELEKIKELTKDPFDASVGAIRSVTAEFDRLNQRAELAQRGISLTTKQLGEYSRISAEVKGKVLELGLDPKTGAGLEKYNQLLAENRSKYIEVATAANKLEQAEALRNKTLRESERALAAQAQAQATMMNDAVRLYQNSEVEKAQALANRMRLEATSGDDAVQLFYKNEQKKAQAFEARMRKEATMMDSAVAMYYKQQGKSTGSSAQTAATRELAQATKWLANEEARMVSVVNSLSTAQEHNTVVSEKAARSIANYERNLSKVGITGEAAAAKLDTYRKQQAAIQSLEENRQAKFLTRALQPQIGDVAISLAAGQNPLTVLLQQGDQIRGLIAQTGVSGELLRKTMQNAFADTLTSIKDTAVAMGSVLGGAFITLGKNIAGVVTGPIAAFTAASAAGANAAGSFTAAITAMNAAFVRLIGNPIVATLVLIAAAVIALGVALYKSVSQQSELNKALAMNSAAFKMSTGEAIAYAQSLATNGESASKYVDIITNMAQVGYKAGDNFKLVADSAISMEKYAGVAIDDTIKKFADLQKEPLEGVIKLAKETGRVPAEVIKLVAELERQGKVAEAAAIATKAMADVNSQTVNQIASDAGYLEKIWTNTISFLKGLWGDFKDAVLGWGVPDSTETKIKALQARINDTRPLMRGDSAQAKVELEMLSRQLAAEKAIKQEAIEKERLAKFMIGHQQDLDKYAQNDVKRANELLKVRERNNALVAAGQITREAADKQEADIADKLKDPKKTKTDGEKEAEKRQKALNQAMEKYNDIMNISLDYNASWNDELRALDLLLKERSITQSQYDEAREKAFAKQPYAIKYLKEEAEAQNELVKAQSLINGLLDKSNGAGKAYTDTLNALNAMEGKPGIDPAQLQLAKEALEQTTPAMKAYNAVVADYGKTMSDITAQRVDVAGQYDMDFKTDDQKAALASLSKFTRSTLEADAQYEKDIADAKSKLTGDKLASALQMYENEADAKKRLAQDVYDRERYLQSETFQLYSAGFDALKGLATDFGRTVTDEFMNFATTGKSSFEALTSSFGNMVQKMIYDLIRLRIQKQVTGLFDQLITMGVNYMVNGTAATSPTSSSVVPNFTMQAANGAAFTNGVQMFAKGGVFDGPTMFKHSGGLGVLGEEGSEAVMPLKRDSSGSLGVVAQGVGGGSNVEVVINNYGSDKATTTETVDSRGNRKINVTIGEIVASELSRSGSSTQQAMASTYGQRPQLIRR